MSPFQSKPKFIQSYNPTKHEYSRNTQRQKNAVLCSLFATFLLIVWLEIGMETVKHGKLVFELKWGDEICKKSLRKFNAESAEAFDMHRFIIFDGFFNYLYMYKLQIYSSTPCLLHWTSKHERMVSPPEK